ncbi:MULTISPECIES: hypothetical protein [Prosthecochloris]|uniref:Uncharacterized protein n=1 Tax=Prosthecochloris marina TaxID=2017681 RepID=A0A317T8P1_9CHLB|nr:MULTISPECIES: hypothetical protein [Prosthecochloris]PWW82710.1 hypothetical protein CR164_02905 [Prosthecochloris marina]UZJ38001.1 hypothetical protein OO005_02015 [Prosthecochloris sp. SCSIO W1103]
MASEKTVNTERQAPVVESKKRQYILEGKIKPCFCEGCEELTEKVFVGEWKPSDKPKNYDVLGTSTSKKSEKKKTEEGEVQSAAENQYWIRCASCNQVYLLKEWQIQIDKELNLQELNPEDCQLYSPHGIYAQGDAVYHKSLDEVGVVREKNATGSGAHVIIVEFIKSGKKQLLENVQVSQGKPGQNESLTEILKLKLKR